MHNSEPAGDPSWTAWLAVPLPACLSNGEGRILAANERWRAEIGTGDHLPAELFPGKDAAAAGQLQRSVELRVPRGSGERWWRCSLQALPSGEVQVVAQDISTEKQLVRALARWDRLLTLGSLTGGIAHELNNPLSSLVTNVAFVQQETKRLEGDPALREDLLGAVEDAAVAVQRLRQVVLGLASFASADPEPQPLDANVQLEALVALAQGDLRHRTQVVLELERSIPHVLADTPSFAQVCMTLLLLGAYGSPPGRAPANRITVRTYAGSLGVAVEVVASGPGVPGTVEPTPVLLNEALPAAMGPDRPMSSLALWVAQQRVRELKGSLAIESHPQRGCVFLLQLPAVGVVPASPSPGAAAVDARSVSILLVEDDGLVAASLRRMLADYDVRIAPGGREAARILMHESFDLILCDLMMPDVSGMDLFELVAVDRPELCERFVFITGGAYTDRAREFLAAHPNPSLTKPFAPDAFLELVRGRLLKLL